MLKGHFLEFRVVVVDFIIAEKKMPIITWKTLKIETEGEKTHTLKPDSDTSQILTQRMLLCLPEAYPINSL